MRGRVAFMLIVALTLSGCGGGLDLPSFAYRHYGDRVKAQSGGLLGTPCMKNYKERSLTNSRCYLWGQTKLHSGVLLLRGFGRPVFIEGEVKPTADLLWGVGNWEAVSDTYRLMRLAPRKNAKDRMPIQKIIADEPRAYRIAFQGRQTAQSGGRYLAGLYLIEHIDSIQRVPWNPER